MNENRVAMTPAGAHAFCQSGHEVIIEKSAGIRSGFKNKEYVEADASIIDTPEGFFNKADMIMKIKEPMPVEYDRLKSHQILFIYFHFASGFGLTKAMMKNNIICITYETVQTADSALPLLGPMSEVAGEMSAHAAAYYLTLPYGGTSRYMCSKSGSQYWSKSHFIRYQYQQVKIFG